MSSIESRLSRRTANTDSWFHTGIMVCAVALLSFLTAKLGGALVLRPQMLWPLWPGCAFLVAVLLLVPRRIWPILIAAGLAGFVLYDLQAGLTLRSIALLIVGDMVEVLIAVLGLSYAFDGLLRLNSIKSLAKYSFFAVILAPLPAAFIGTAAFGGNYWIRWRIDFFTEALALLTLTPAILSWVGTRQAWIRKSRAFYFEGATLIAGLTLLAYVSFVAHSRSSLPVLLYSLLPFLLWSALRFGMMGISTSMIVVAFLSIWGAVRGRGPFTGAEPLNNVMSLQLFLFVAATTFMVLAVLVEERKQTERALREGEERLRVAAEVGRMYAWEWDPATDAVLRSAECADILGLSAAGEGLAKDFLSFIHPDDRAELRRLVDSLTPEDPVYRTQYRRFRPDGRLLWLEESSCATFDGSGKMVRLVGMTADITERKRVEEALRESEERFRLASQVGKMYAYEWDVATDRVVRSGECVNVLGVGDGAKQLTRQRLVANVHPDDRALFMGSVDQRSPENPTTQISYRMFHPDGSVVWLEKTARAFFDEHGKMLRAVGMVADVTERKQAEEALRESQQRMTGIVVSAMDSIISVDEQQRIVLFNAAAERMFRCSATEAMGQPVERFIPERFRSAHGAHIRRFGETGVTNRVIGALDSLWAVRADGEEFQVEASISRIESSGKPLFTVILRDVTDRRRAEEALRKSEERFSKAFRSSPLAVTISTEAEGRYLEVNEAFLQMLGYELREVIGRTAQELDFWEEPSQRLEMIRQLKESGRVAGFPTQFTTSKGERRQAEVSAEAVELEGQRCMLAITRDITETRQLEEQLRQANKMEAVGLLAGGISHDFNNLLNVILGNTDLLLEKMQSGKPQHYAEAIKKATQRATQLTRQLLAFSRKQALRPALLDVNAVVSDVVKILRHLVGEDVHIVVEDEPNLASVWADPGQVEQILMNLATNARDAMPNGGIFTIRTENAELGPDHIVHHPYVAPGRYVRLSVSDTGLGMSEEVQSRAFEPFFTTKPLGGGTGLGLATVYGIVKQSGGYVWISSVLGAGTTFDIYLPRVDEPAPALIGELEERSECPKGTETVLLLEDEESLREVTCEMLTAGGYSVLQAGRGGQAIELARQYEGLIHLMVSDVVLPDISGLSAVAAVQALHPETKVLFVSGYAERPVVQKIIAAGALLLQKPVSRSDLLREMDEILHLRSPSAKGVQSQ
jgi:two-component system, cell cycle sensor histidine kinase and response regulator CckA